jgi:hypothetical protein
MEKYNYKFYGVINTYKHQYYYFFILFIALTTIFILKDINLDYALISIIFFLIVIITMILIFKKEKNFILFTEKNIIRIQNRRIVEFDYASVLKLEFHYAQKGNSFSKLTTENNKYVFNSKVNSFGFSKYQTLYELLLSKNPEIEIYEKNFLDKHKFFLNNGEVKKVEIP